MKSPLNASTTDNRFAWARVVFIATTFWFSLAANAEVALGSARAPVTIVEYGSLTCDYCVRFHREVLPLIKSRHIDTGRVRFIYRDFPTSAAATRGAVAARCAGGHYYTMLDALYAAVGGWSRARDVDAALLQQAVSLGLDEEPFRVCLDDPRHISAIDDEQRRSEIEYGVLGTPTFLINGKVVAGIRDIDEIDALIDEALSERRQQSPDVDVGTYGRRK